VAVKTAAQELAEIDAAITAVLAGGQEMQVDGQRIKLPDLATLNARRDIVAARAAREARGGGLRVSIGTGGGR
jgi:hypothetical protein